MPASEALVQTPNASNYLIRLSQHVSKMRGHLDHQPHRHREGGGPPAGGEAEGSDTDGILALSLGKCILRAADGMLSIRAEASSAENLNQMQTLITKRLESFGRRERLTVTWQHATDLTPEPGTDPDSDASADGNGRASD